MLQVRPMHRTPSPQPQLIAHPLHPSGRAASLAGNKVIAANSRTKGQITSLQGFKNPNLKMHELPAQQKWPADCPFAARAHDEPAPLITRGCREE